MGTVVGDPNSVKKHVPPPTLEPKLGDAEFIGFDDEYGHYHIGKIRWKFLMQGRSRAKQVRLKLREFDQKSIIIQDKNTRVIELVEKQNKTKLTNEELTEYSKLQVEISKYRQEQDDMKDTLIDDLLPTLLQEMDGTPFNEKHFDNNDISNTQWWASTVDLTNFLLVGDKKVGKLLSQMR